MITKEQAEERFANNEFYRFTRFYHKTLKKADKKTPIEAKRNGSTKTLKKTKDFFQIPIKIGLYSYGYINNENAHEWSVTQPE